MMGYSIASRYVQGNNMKRALERFIEKNPKSEKSVLLQKWLSDRKRGYTSLESERLKEEVLKRVSKKNVLTTEELAAETGVKRDRWAGWNSTCVASKLLFELHREGKLEYHPRPGRTSFIIHAEPHKLFAASLWESKGMKSGVPPKASVIFGIKKHGYFHAAPGRKDLKDFAESLVEKFPDVFMKAKRPGGKVVMVKDKKKFNEMHDTLRKVLRLKKR
jgi:hypothetical protein